MSSPLVPSPTNNNNNPTSSPTPSTLSALLSAIANLSRPPSISLLPTTPASSLLTLLSTCAPPPDTPATPRDSLLSHIATLYATLHSSSIPSETLQILHERLVAHLRGVIIPSFQIPSDNVVSPLSTASAAREVVFRHVIRTSHQAGATPAIIHIHHTNDAPATCWAALSDLFADYKPLSVPSFEAVYSALSTTLRDIVTKTHLQPALIILQLHITHSLLPALEVCRTLSNTYNAHFHVEGSATLLPLLNHAPLLHPYTSLYTADTVLLDLQPLLKLPLCAVFLLGLAHVQPPSLSHIAPLFTLSYALEVLDLALIARTLSSSVSYLANLCDCLYRISSLLHCDMVGVGVDLQLQYLHSNPERQAHVHKSLLSLLPTVKITPEPSHIFVSAFDLLPHRPGDAEQTAVELLRRVRICEQALVLTPSFLSHIRQNVDIKPVPATDACYIAGVQVTPLGQVPRLVTKYDSATRAIVERHTRAFGEATVTGFGIVYDAASGVAWIMPRLGGSLNEGENAAEGIERLAADWETCETSGVLIADQVGLVVGEVVASVEREEGRRRGVQDAVDEGDGNILRIPADRGKVGGGVTVMSPVKSGGAGDTERGSGVDFDVVRSALQADEGVDVEAAEDGDGAAQMGGGEDSVESVNGIGEVVVEEEEEDDDDGEGQVVGEEEGLQLQKESRKTEKSRGGIWGLLFGEQDDDESDSDVDVDAELEEDYFRP